MRIRTGYSFRTAVGRIAEVMDRLKEVGYHCAPITDRASTFGFQRWTKAAKKAGLKPIYGVELAVSYEAHAKKPAMGHVTFIAKETLEGIHTLIEIATNQFRYEPLLTYEQAMESDTIKILGSRASVFHVDPGTPDLYYALSPSLAHGQLMLLRAAGIKPIACSDNYMPSAEYLPAYEAICGRGASNQTYKLHILSHEEWAKSLPRSVTAEEKAEALRNFEAVMNQSTATMLRAAVLSPERPDTLRNMCIAGAKKLNCDISDPVYAARLNKELELIDFKDFSDYFYIITDMVQWARKNMVVGPARGSSAGSLVCYLLEITTIDPIKFDLIFERFIDIQRGGWFMDEVEKVEEEPEDDELGDEEDVV